MKKVLVVLVALTGFVSSNAQNLSLGPVASFNHSWIAGYDAGREFKPGFKVGAMINYSIHPHWAIGADVVLTNEGAKSKSTFGSLESTSKVNLNYIRVPLKAIYFFGKLGDRLRPKLYAGPSFGLLVGGKIKNEARNTAMNTSTTTEYKSKDFYESFDFGVMAGAGLNYRIARATWLNVDVNYTNGLRDISKATNWVANRNLGIAVGVTFPVGTFKPKK